VSLICERFSLVLRTILACAANDFTVSHETNSLPGNKMYVVCLKKFSLQKSFCIEQFFKFKKFTFVLSKSLFVIDCPEQVHKFHETQIVCQQFYSDFCKYMHKLHEITALPIVIIILIFCTCSVHLYTLVKYFFYFFFQDKSRYVYIATYIILNFLL
jgi:hypothetical protein